MYLVCTFPIFLRYRNVLRRFKEAIENAKDYRWNVNREALSRQQQLIKWGGILAIKNVTQT